VNGHDVFVNDVPVEMKKNFDPKRIDHRHHAMDALVIALTTEEHVQYLKQYIFSRRK
jgi:CRISPR-associated endonuclease Csn1